MKIKNFILLHLLFAIIVFNNKTNAQNFAPVGAVWYYTRPLLAYPAVSYTKFESIKDTVVNGLNCKLVESYIPTDIFGNAVVERNNYIFYSENSKVYTIESGQQLLLYDFSKNIGEYWTIPSSCCNDTIFVDSVKYITLTNGQTRRVQYVHNTLAGSDIYFGGAIIDNIGNSCFLFPYIASATPPEGGPRRCYSENGVIVHSEFQPCDYQSGINENKLVQDKIWVQNPIIHDLNIQIVDLSLLPLKTMDVYNNLENLFSKKTI